MSKIFLIPTSGFNTPMPASIRKKFSHLIPHGLAPRLLIYIAFSVVVIGITSCDNSTKRKPNKNLPPKYAVKTEPKFNHQSDLWFINAVNDTIMQIEIEIADTDRKRETGMMHRKSMRYDRGMLFVFPDESRRSFWMKETHVSLDIIFVNANKEIIHIAENCQPYSLKSIPSFEYAQYVVEVNAGFCQEYSVKTGNLISFR